MDIMETFTVDVTGGHWGLAVGVIAIGAFVIPAVVHLGFAIAVFRDATGSKKPIFVGGIIWFLATLIGGVFGAGIYWVMHHSRLNQSVPITPTED